MLADEGIDEPVLEVMFHLDIPKIREDVSLLLCIGVLGDRSIPFGRGRRRYLFVADYIGIQFILQSDVLVSKHLQHLVMRIPCHHREKPFLFDTNSSLERIELLSIFFHCECSQIYV